MSKISSSISPEKLILPMSVVIIVRNEELNIDRCLSALKWADEVVVVNNESTDSTCARAIKYSNVTLLHSDWHGFSETKRIGVRCARNSWILWLDADEVLPPALQDEIVREFSQLSQAQNNVFAIDRKTFFLGRWIRGCGWYPSRVVRLFNREFADFNGNYLHEGITLSSGANVKVFKVSLLHDSYHSLKSYFSKMIKYGELGALELERKNSNANFFDVIFRPSVAFIRSFIFRRGFLDGGAGIIISVGTAFSVFIKYSTYYYYKKEGAFEKMRPLEVWEKQ